MTNVTATFRPRIELEGTRIDVRTGGTRTLNYRTGVNHVPLVSGTSVINVRDKLDPLTFVGKVKVYIIPYPSYRQLPAQAFAAGNYADPNSNLRVADGSAHRGKPDAHIHITAPKTDRYAYNFEISNSSLAFSTFIISYGFYNYMIRTTLIIPYINMSLLSP